MLTERAEVTTGQAWDVARIGRKGTGCDIAQGFAGVCIAPDWLARPEAVPPTDARGADDVWLSAVLASQGIPVRSVEAARAGLQPAYSDTPSLQTGLFDGRSRDQANRAAAECAERRFGIWPRL